MSRDNNPAQVEKLIRRQIAEAITRGTVGPRDRFGSPIKAGDMVIFQQQTDLVFDVMDVKPNMHPQAPPGMVTIILGTQFAVNMIANSTQPQLLRHGTFQVDANDEPTHRSFEGPKIGVGADGQPVLPSDDGENSNG